MFVLILYSKIKRYLEEKSEIRIPKKEPQSTPEISTYYKELSDLDKLKIIHDTFQEFYPYSFEVVTSSFLDNPNSNRSDLDVLLKLKKSYDHLVKTRKYETLYDRQSALRSAQSEINKEYKGISLHSLFRLHRKNRKLDFLTKRASKDPFELVEVDLSRMRHNFDRMYVATSWVDQTSQIMNIGSSDDREIKRLRDGTEWNDFYSLFAGSGVILNNKTILIEPVFESVRYYTRHHVFCGMIADPKSRNAKNQDIRQISYYKYYFDLKGRLIGEDYGLYWYNDLPKFGVNYHLPAKEQIVEIDTDAFETRIYPVFSSSYYSFTVNKGNRSVGYGLVNEKNQFVLSDTFRKMILFEQDQRMIGEKEGGVFLYNLNSRQLIRELNYSGFRNDNDYSKDRILPDFVAVYNKDEENGSFKFGVINPFGEEIIPIVYRYIDKIKNFDYLRIIDNENSLGKSYWEDEDEYLDNGHDEFRDFDHKAQEWFDTYGDDPWTSHNYITSTYIGNHWGIINYKNEVIIPPTYGWLEFLDSEILKVNMGGGVIEYYNWDKKEDRHILGGKFGVINLRNEVLIPLEYDVLFRHHDEIWAQKIENQRFDSKKPYDIFDFNEGKITRKNLEKS